MARNRKAKELRPDVWDFAPHAGDEHDRLVVMPSGNACRKAVYGRLWLTRIIR
jgi:hypothetical protein